MSTHTLTGKDGRTTTVNGTKLATGSSDDGHRLRWTTLDLYRADAGPYVLHRQGASRVYHLPATTCKVNVGDRVHVSDITDWQYGDLVSCPICAPLDLDDLEETDQVLIEGTVGTVIACRDAAAAYQASHATNREGIRYVPAYANVMLHQAAVLDDGIREAVDGNVI